MGGLRTRFRPAVTPADFTKADGSLGRQLTGSLFLELRVDRSMSRERYALKTCNAETHHRQKERSNRAQQFQLECDLDEMRCLETDN